MDLYHVFYHFLTGQQTAEVTHRYLLHLLLHGVDCGGRCGESLDGLSGRGQNTLVLNGHRLELLRRHNALHLWLED